MWDKETLKDGEGEREYFRDHYVVDSFIYDI